MGRKKNQSRDEVLNKAMQAFRAHGYGGTSADMLVDQTGVSRYSLYADFGSKQGLFAAALERYDAQVISHSFGPLEQADAGLDEISALLASYGSAWNGHAAGKGCLLCNTAVEFGAEDPTDAGLIHLYFRRLSSAFANALGNAQRRGQVRSALDTSAEADFLTALVLGLFVMIRAKAPTAMIENAAGLAISHVAGLAE
ncbi:MAG: TetR family transcriptional regulator [Limimaricola sp.]|uniref:TetR/AcrR family transcriptional regulator n=1 Tax=Limimaricola sp. TaxID=2211665 RepID=UPI001DFE6DC6|nr:TetR/AcrR family transcriptional regulator [Limimaricola sp.]MBI1417680.1 TetR family transcriptional regulator [Limimaricola sp.]